MQCLNIVEHKVTPSPLWRAVQLSAEGGGECRTFPQPGVPPRRCAEWIHATGTESGTSGEKRDEILGRVTGDLHQVLCNSEECFTSQNGGKANWRRLGGVEEHGADKQIGEGGMCASCSSLVLLCTESLAVVVPHQVSDLVLCLLLIPVALIVIWG